MTTTQTTWQRCEQTRSAAMTWLKQARITLAPDPHKQIGQLNEKIAALREWAFRVRDEIFDAKGLLSDLKRELYAAQDTYEAALEVEMFKVRPEEELAKLPKTKDERNAYFRRTLTAQYRTQVEAERRVEQWEQYEKQLHSIYYSLKDSEQALERQIGVIKQQYFSGELKMDKSAASLADFLGDDVKALLNRPTAVTPEEIPVNGDLELQW